MWRSTVVSGHPYCNQTKTLRKRETTLNSCLISDSWGQLRSHDPDESYCLGQKGSSAVARQEPKTWGIDLSNATLFGFTGHRDWWCNKENTQSDTRVKHTVSAELEGRAPADICGCTSGQELFRAKRLETSSADDTASQRHSGLFYESGTASFDSPARLGRGSKIPGRSRLLQAGQVVKYLSRVYRWRENTENPPHRKIKGDGVKRWPHLCQSGQFWSVTVHECPA
ncbi:hypothetical protein RRG08_003496 [Elysia crispata]|uniref:Uncharacterized protein n=1 Tax=Elysia crispata TaxID=231223 RepID=A0AAE1CTL3_9GAST|nr:hypothetical protein RRG08_003496 [Elysia crispata]